MDESKDKDLDFLSSRVEKVEHAMEKNCEKLQSLENTTTACRLGCELPSYKKEIKERCEKLDLQIKGNTNNCKMEKQNILDKIRDVENEFEYKFKQSRTLIGRVISTGVVFCVALVGIFGNIQVNKVSQQEYNNYLESYRVDKQEQINRFNDFIHTYTSDREKRDNKIDSMFERQLDFNHEIVKQNAILQQQLEVLKTKMEM